MKNRNRLESPTPANPCGSPTTTANNNSNSSSLLLANSNGSSSTNASASIPSNNGSSNGLANGAINNSITTGNGSGNVNDASSGTNIDAGNICSSNNNNANNMLSSIGGTLILTTTAAMQQQQHHKSSMHHSPPNSYNNNHHHHNNNNTITTTTTNGHQSYPSISSTYWLPPPNPAPYLVPERKLFVGMLNKKYNEADVRQLFTGHGTIEECTVLRDQNGQSKGCAFVTFATKHNAIGAIKALHQSRTMEGCSAPLVVKFADTQKEKDQKKMQQLQASLVGITALTTPSSGSIAGLAATPANGLSPASGATLVPSPITAASVRSNSSMSAALAAVAAAPQPTAIASPTSALVPTSAAISVSPSLLTAAGQAPQQASPYLTTTDAMNASAAQLHLFQQLQAFGLHPAQYLQGLNFPPDHSVTTASLSAAAAAAAANAAVNHATANAADASGQSGNTVGNGLLSARSIPMQNLVTLAALGAHQYAPSQTLQQTHHSHLVTSAHQQQQQQQQQSQQQQQHQQQQRQIHGLTYAPTQALSTSNQAQMAQLLQTPLTMSAQLTGATAANLWPGGESLSSPYAQTLSPLTNGGAFATTTSPLTAAALQAAAAGVAGKQVEGPDGSNLFIYHLPQEFTDTDLASTFLPFGSVLSAKVFIDKQTNLSKCFGFVSYDNPLSASAAIQAMHGFQIGTKRLKVQLKRSKDAAKPY
ncbi:CUGBP Elav-like family member 2 isoform X3 [Zeugodacus cucurbitae]|uniref:CUGBP Elav-like family member 2 isoform X3 n=1 Tax=Zeugodacus cucurbitae TaxID=28588 RepID=UPI0023D95099|nr:CUGBP Elav-like family member 2 isoform X3 [Zeugodacus cucurbitae]XP_028898897.2 CUGBP Elav-like family member 2 isoform X3 [Zeugodacus cucurbitae]XP_054084016.1 CUGBP Elav-like family member 2 isoform X3 [Zeugodacus cucurbitae]XP_054084018.1 CUGBP Elav-like family member 2 isoform X3 [Zeugodacus cucurbitae]